MTSDLRPVDMHTTIPDALRREIDDDLAAGGERARKWRPRATCGVTRILALDGPYAGRVGTPTGIAGWTYDDGNFGRIFISADGGTPWLFGLDETPPSHPVTAWAPVGSIDRPRGLDLQAPNPRPADGDRVLVLDAPTDWVVGNVATCRIAGGSPAVRVDETRDLFFIHRWALLPPAVSDSAAVERVPAAVTTAARQTAYDAADKVTTISRRHVEAIVDAALNALAGDLHIAPNDHGRRCIWRPQPGWPKSPEPVAGEDSVYTPVWELLEAVIPTRDESSAGVACEACGFEHDEDEPHLMDAP